MPENGDSDIIDQIDALTGDAASWSATGDHTRPWWATPAAGSMTAVGLNMTGAGPVDLSETNPGRDIAHHVGDPGVDRVTHLRRMQFWVGDNSTANSPVNTGATRLLHQLLADVRDGHYIASDYERDHARALLDAPEALPVIHGPCLITGVGDSGTAAPLDDNFQTWLTALLDDIAQLRESLATAIARETGIPLEQIGHITVVRLG